MGLWVKMKISGLPHRPPAGHPQTAVKACLISLSNLDCTTEDT